MTGEHPDGSWLAARLTADPAFRSALLEASAGRAPGGYLRAHAALSEWLGEDRVRGIGDDGYRDAARELDDAGDHAAARVVAGIGAASRELAAVRLDWERRYQGRPRTRAQQDADGLLASGRVRRSAGPPLDGADGAQYARAGFRLYSSTFTEPAAVVTTLVGATEIVTGFRDERAREEWLADRSPGRHGPLASVLDGPPCRAAREELVLAWLLRRPRPGRLPDWPLPQTFTTCTRSEIYLAWQAAPVGAVADQVAEVLGNRLLRAPAWGSCDFGEPRSRTAPAYLHRLAATPAATERVAAALRDLAVEDATPAHDPGPAAPPLPAAPSVPASRPAPLRLIQPPPPEPPPGLSPRT